MRESLYKDEMDAIGQDEIRRCGICDVMKMQKCITDLENDESLLFRFVRWVELV